jgi:acyl dehydratase
MSDAQNHATYGDITIGETASFTVEITHELVDAFATLSGDRNPLHMDEAYAARTAFGGRIAHGMIVGALFSRLVGMELPGRRSLYLSQSLHFHGPVPIGTKLIIRGEIVHKTDAHKTVSIRTTAEDLDSKKLLVSGDAIVQLLP